MADFNTFMKYCGPELRYYQEEATDAAICDMEAGKPALVVIGTGGGKCLRAGTTILMLDGSVKPVEKIEVGDWVMSPNGGGAKIVALTSGLDQMYQIVPRKGEPFVVSSEHQLSLVITNISTRKVYDSKGRGFGSGETLDITVLDYLASSGKFKHVAKGFRQGVDFVSADELRIDPYILGLWLGDGHQSSPAITTGDFEIYQSFSSFCAKRKLGLRLEALQEGAFAMRASAGRGDGGPKKGRNSFLNDLDYYKLRETKRIPKAYLTASRENRLELLAGILDSDGHYTKKGYDIIQKREDLLEDILFLARSLGFSAYKSTQDKRCGNNDVWGTYHRTNISGHVEQIPCRVERNKGEPRKQKKNVLRFGFSVVPVGVGEFFGFEVDSDDHRFLLGDFTVTHNSLIIAKTVQKLLTKYPDSDITVLVHVKELVASDAAAIKAALPKLDVGIYCAGLGQKRLGKVTVANIKSVVNLNALHKKTDIVIIDEVDLVSVEEEGQYRFFLNSIARYNERYGLVGLTATPFRLKEGNIYGEGRLFTHISYNKPLTDLIREGFNVPFVTKEVEEFDEKSAKKARGEYVLSAVSRKMSAMEQVESHTDKIIERTQERKTVLIFACDTVHAVALTNALRSKGQTAEFVVSDSSYMTDKERDRRIEAFANGKIKYLVNIGIMTTGTNIPRIDCIVILRPTDSMRLFLQILGRGSRLDVIRGKINCLAIDFGGNFARFGFLDEMEAGSGGKGGGSGGEKMAKKCTSHPNCEIMSPLQARTCECGAEFPPPVTKNETQAYIGAVTSDQVDTWQDVVDVSYTKHVSAKGNECVKVIYGLNKSKTKTVSEYLVFSNGLEARMKLVNFMSSIGLENFPTNCDEMVVYLRARAPQITGIRVVREGKHPGVRDRRVADGG